MLLESRLPKSIKPFLLGNLYLACDKATAIDFEENAEERIESANLEWKKLNTQN